MDLKRLAAELVRHLRGQRSQPALSRRLGYASNVVYMWESARRAPTASAFFGLAARSRIDVRAALGSFLDDGSQAPDPCRSGGVAKLLNATRSERSLVEISAAIGIDRTTLARWFDGDTEPRLPELLRYIETTTQRLLEFVALFADPAELASARDRYADLVAQRRLAYELPWSHAVLRALELDAYRALDEHEPGFIARHVGISAAEEARYLDALVAARQIALENGRYVLRQVLTVDTRPNERENRQLKLHWSKVAIERFGSGSIPGAALFSYNLFAIGERDFERIRRLHSEYFDRVRDIVAESSGADRVVLMNAQLLPLHAGS